MLHLGKCVRLPHFARFPDCYLQIGVTEEEMRYSSRAARSILFTTLIAGLVISVTCTVCAQQGVGNSPSRATEVTAGSVTLPRPDLSMDPRELRPKAERGDAAAQNNLGACYGKGEGVAQDHKEAVR